MSETKTTPAKTTRAATGAKPRKRRPNAPSGVPWIEGGIDYGPALVAVDELIAWAFDLAAQGVADSREGQRRVKNARRYITAAIRGKRARVREEDVVFTASLLIRIFDADLHLNLGDIVTVLSELGLPTIDVPHAPRPVVRPSRAVPAAPAAPAAAELAAFVSALQRAHTPPAPVVPVVPLRRPTDAVRVSAPTSCAGCCLGFARAA